VFRADQMRNPVCDYARLAAAGAGQNQNRAFGRFYSFTLLGIEARKEVHVWLYFRIGLHWKINTGMAYTKLASLVELPAGSLLEIVHGNELYALCNVEGDIRALSGVCPHHGGPLGQGALEGSFVTCPWHAWQFDSATGACAFNDALRIPTYPVRIEAGEILVDLNPELHA
jgi:nitrite reductase (NADH) small subunit